MTVVPVNEAIEYERKLAKEAKDYATAHTSITRELIRILYQVEIYQLWTLDKRYTGLRDWASQNIEPYLEESSKQSISIWCGTANMLVGIAYEQSPEIAEKIVEKTPVEALKRLRNDQQTATPEQKEKITEAFLSGNTATQIIKQVKDILPAKPVTRSSVYIKEAEDGTWVITGNITFEEVMKLQNAGIFDVRLGGE